MLNTPVALIIFRRPDLTAKVLDAIRVAKPKQLFVVADGPRADTPGEAEACEATRALIDTVDWDCEVHKNYSDTNLGCGYRPATGIDWVFENVESAIILEDDCIPDPSFFGFCQEVLERYRDDERVMHVSGCTYLPETWDTEDSFFFSRFPACWGWATWRRAWELYDFECHDWPALRATDLLADVIGNPLVEAYWTEKFDESVSMHYWDYQWALACWANSGLSVCPRHNLISNVGDGDDATHTKGGGIASMSLPTYTMPLPLRHPRHVLGHAALNRQYVEKRMLPSALKQQGPGGNRFTRAVKGALPRSLKDGLKRLVR